MDFRQRLMRRAIGTAAERAIENAASNPRRAVRNLVDLGATFAAGERQKAFFRQAQTLTADSKSPWSALLGRIAREASPDTVKLIGVNLGYTALTCGSRLLEQTAKDWNTAVPWVLNLDPSPAEIPALSALLADANRFGVYTWALRLHDSAGVQALSELAMQFTENTFWVTLPPAAANSQNCLLLAAPKNIVAAVALETDSPYEAALRELSEQRLLFGFSAEDPAVFRSDTLLQSLCGQGCIFGVYTGIQPIDSPPFFSDRFFFTDTERNRPLFLIDWERDTRLIGGLVASGCAGMQIQEKDLLAAGFSLEHLMKKPIA